MLFLGYFCLLQRSEIVATLPGHFHFSTTPEDKGDYLWIPHSKTDQAQRGCRIPLPRTIPVVGDIRHIVGRMTDVFCVFDWPMECTPLMCTYNAAKKALSSKPMHKDLVMGRLHHLLDKHLALSKP